MNDDSIITKVRETNQRVTRIETRLMILGNKLGFDLKEDDVIAVDAQKRTVSLQQMDVSLSSIVNAARRAGLHGVDVTTFFNGNFVATITV